MKIFISKSAKAIGDLYHVTRIGSLLQMMRTGNMQLAIAQSTFEAKYSKKEFFASFTRSKFGSYHISKEGNRWSQASVILVINGTMLSDKYQVHPVQYFSHRPNARQAADVNEMEERLTASVPQIPIVKYIKQVIILVPPENVETDARAMQFMASTIRRLRSAKIPYAFYHSAKEWAMGKDPAPVPDIHIGGKKLDPNISYTSTYTYKNLQAILEALGPKPYEGLSGAAQAVCQNAYRYPTDRGSALTDYVNGRRDFSSPLYGLCVKIARVLSRLKINDEHEAGKYLAHKYEIYYVEQEKIRQKERNEGIERELIFMLENPAAEWPYDKFSWFRGAQDSFDQYAGHAQDVLDNLFYSHDPSTKLLQVCKKLDIEPNSASLISYLIHKKGQ